MASSPDYNIDLAAFAEARDLREFMSGVDYDLMEEIDHYPDSSPRFLEDVYRSKSAHPESECVCLEKFATVLMVLPVNNPKTMGFRSLPLLAWRKVSSGTQRTRALFTRPSCLMVVST